MDVWIDAFATVFPPILWLGALILLGVVLARLKLLNERRVGWLTRLVVAVLLPCLLFSHIVKQFRPDHPDYAGWYWLPILALGVLALGYSLGWLAHRLLAHGDSTRGRRIVFASLCGWQNAGYVPIPIIAALYGGEAKELVYCFLFILGFSPGMWSLAPLNMARAGHAAKGSVEWRRLITPPFAANLLGITLCLTGVPQWFVATCSEQTLDRVLAPLLWLGDACIPAIMVTLGAMLARRQGTTRTGARFAWGLIGVKLVLMPIVMGLIILFVREIWAVGPGVLALFFIESASPPATGMTIIARRYGGKQQSELVNQAVLWSYLAALVTLPVWLTVGRAALGLFGP